MGHLFWSSKWAIIGPIIILVVLMAGVEAYTRVVYLPSPMGVTIKCVGVEEIPVIQVPVGSNLIIRVESRDIQHTVSIPALGIERMIPTGADSAISVRVDHPGRFELHCTPTGYPQTHGTIVVSEFGAMIEERPHGH